MKSAVLAVICCFLLIGAMAMPRDEFPRRGRRFETRRSLDDDDSKERFEGHNNYNWERRSENHMSDDDDSGRRSEDHMSSDDDSGRRSENHMSNDDDSGRRSEDHMSSDDDSGRRIGTRRSLDDDDSSKTHRRFVRRPETRSSFRGLSDQSQCGYAVNYVYRWYNSNTGDYQYCFDSEGQSGSDGYTYQEMAFETLKYQQDSSVEFYSLYSSEGGYFYTTNYQQVQRAERSGWQLQESIGFVFTIQVSGSFAIHQYYNSRINQHFYTIHPESENLNGWTDQGVIGYTFDTSSNC